MNPPLARHARSRPGRAHGPPFIAPAPWWVCRCGRPSGAVGQGELFSPTASGARCQSITVFPAAGRTWTDVGFNGAGCTASAVISTPPSSSIGLSDPSRGRNALSTLARGRRVYSSVHGQGGPPVSGVHTGAEGPCSSMSSRTAAARGTSRARAATRGCWAMTDERVRKAAYVWDVSQRASVVLLGVVPMRAAFWMPRSREPALITECRDHLYRLQTVQSVTYGASGARWAECSTWDPPSVPPSRLPLSRCLNWSGDCAGRLCDGWACLPWSEIRPSNRQLTHHIYPSHGLVTDPLGPGVDRWVVRCPIRCH